MPDAGADRNANGKTGPRPHTIVFNAGPSGTIGLGSELPSISATTLTIIEPATVLGVAKDGRHMNRLIEVNHFLA